MNRGILPLYEIECKNGHLVYIGIVFNTADDRTVEKCSHQHKTLEAAEKCAAKMANKWNQ